MLNGLKLSQVFNGLAYLVFVHIASVADVAELKVEIIAVEADPISNLLIKVLLFASLILCQFRVITEWPFLRQASVYYLTLLIQLGLNFAAKLDFLIWARVLNKSRLWPEIKMLTVLCRTLIEDFV